MIIIIIISLALVCVIRMLSDADANCTIFLMWIIIVLQAIAAGLKEHKNAQQNGNI